MKTNEERLEGLFQHLDSHICHIHCQRVIAESIIKHRILNKDAVPAPLRHPRQVEF